MGGREDAPIGRGTRHGARGSDGLSQCHSTRTGIGVRGGGGEVLLPLALPRRSWDAGRGFAPPVVYPS